MFLYTYDIYLFRKYQFARTEHIFGEIKEYKHFRRFYHRGLENVGAIWAIVCIACNFRKLARLEYSG